MSLPFMLAPMATLSHRAFRELIAGFGACDLYYSEMIGAAAFLNGGRFEDYYADPLPEPQRLVYQLVGGDADAIVKAAAVLDARRTAGVDLNMGCSAPEIIRTGAGAAWMAAPEAAWRLAERVRSVVGGRLSVKLRLGVAEDGARLLAFVQGLEAAGVDAVVLHPRIQSEKLKRQARWPLVAALRAEAGIPVIGNGDVASPEDLLARAASSCDGVMVGRGAVRSPWIFRAAREAEAGRRYAYENIDLEEIGIRFLELLARHQPPEFWETRARRFFFYFCDNFMWGNYLKTELCRAPELGAKAAVLRAHCRAHPEERTPRRPTL